MAGSCQPVEGWKRDMERRGGGRGGENMDIYILVLLNNSSFLCTWYESFDLADRWLAPKGK